MPSTNHNPNTSDPHDGAELLSAYLDGELTDAQRAEVQQRLETDEGARRLLAELQTISQSLRGLPRETAPRDLHDVVLQEAQRRMQSSDASSQQLELNTIRRFPIGRSRRGWAWAVAAIAAAVLVMVFNPDQDPIEVVKAPAAAEEAPTSDDVAILAAPELHAPSEPAVAAAPPRPAPPAEPFATDALESETPSAAAPAAALAAEEATPGADGPGSGGGGGGFGGYDHSTPAPYEAVVVRLGLRREAFDNRFVDGVLDGNGILVEPTPAALVSNFRANTSNARNATPTRDAARRSRAMNDQPAAAGNLLADEASDHAIDLVLVDAPIPSVVDAVSELNRDFFNCVSIEIEPAVATQQPPIYNQMQQQVFDNRRVVESLDVYSRRGVGPQQMAQTTAPRAANLPAQQRKVAPLKRGAKGKRISPRGIAYRYQPQAVAADDKADLYSQLNYYANETLRFTRAAPNTTATVAAGDASRAPVVFFVQPSEAE